uniref:NADH-ubiquinone oxidoreductase chain 5 n=2 Tax=Pelecinus polyturator TaxID=44352 RepID=A0A0E3EKX7_9HYME|nr:NADH dehydrogenase subunit 5 [Pelecinus polyturator]AIW82472.1 NADH dehydrogenase subunit 5 [Pelecinus polyturator]
MLMVVLSVMFMFICSLMTFYMSVLYFLMKLSMMMEFILYNLNSVEIKFYILMDWISLMFMSVVMLISSLVVMYSVEYMMFDKFKGRFMMLVYMFVLSMILMILSPSMISIIMGWDGLGLVSYCLVIYYQNYSSYMSGMLTVLSNRIGDICLLMAISLMLMVGSYNFMYKDKLILMILMLIVITSITKSAQLPFSSWLPAAMAAPTPVSSLVHSSTLVTAGVYLMIRFNKLLMESNLISSVIMYISLMTMFFSGAYANLENDLKKIIALSTLSQLGLMMMCLSIGQIIYSFFHLVSHAMFKSLLFLCSGVIIHNLIDKQDIRLMGDLLKKMPIILVMFNISSLSLMGFPFLSGFYSKDLILELFLCKKMNFFLIMMFYLSLLFTISYSIRLMFYSFFCIGGSKFNLVKENYFMNLSMYMLMLMSMIYGCLMNWLIFSSVNLMFLSVYMKVVIFYIMLMGVLIGYLNFKLNKNLKLYLYLVSMSYLVYLNQYMMKIFIILSKMLFKYIDKGWNEIFGKSGILKLMNYFNLIYQMNLMYIMIFSLIYFNLMIMFLF